MPLAALKKKSAPAKPVAKAKPISAPPLLSPPARMQAKLEVGPVGDRFEQEADRLPLFELLEFLRSRGALLS